MDISKATAYAMINVMKERWTNANEVALKAGLNRNAIWAITSGSTKKPSVELVHSFCTVTGYTLAEFFSRKEFERVNEND